MSGLELTWHTSFSEMVCTYTQRCTTLFITEQSLWSAFFVQLFKGARYQGWFFIPPLSCCRRSFNVIANAWNIMECSPLARPQVVI